jgi:5-hydroxytryptamine receptor 1
MKNVYNPLFSISFSLNGNNSKELASSSSVKKHVSLEVKRERKAAKTLAIVTGAFIACWLPFFILALFMAFFKTWSFNGHLVSFFLWMGYFNSTLNPIIYTIFSPEFRTAFKRILCGKSHVLNHRPRHLQ